MMIKYFYSMRRLFTLLIVAVILTVGLIYYTDHQVMSGDENSAVIVRVIDGDTYLIRYLGKEEKLRLIGIDTPETQANRKARKDMDRYEKDIKSMIELGNEARNFVNKLIPAGTKIRLEFDVQRRDQYGRLLAYVYLENGEMLNEKIIAEGYANPMTYPPNVKYHQLFMIKYQDARYFKKGLWKKEFD
jgi:micrococcal nuclease